MSLNYIFWIAESILIISAIGMIWIWFLQRRRRKIQKLNSKRRYQEILRKASLSMGRIKDLSHLLKLTTHVITRAIKVEYCCVYLFHEESAKFVLKSFKTGDLKIQFCNVISKESLVIKHLYSTRQPIYSNNLDFKTITAKDKDLFVELSLIPAAAVLPCFIDNRLIAIIGLGNKNDRTRYSIDDLMLFSILANQVGMAIENAQFYDHTRAIQEQLIRAEKMATVGTMADGISHQMNNRLHAMGFIAGDALDVLRNKNLDDLPIELKSFVKELEFSLLRLEDNIKRGGELTEGLLKYTRKSNEKFEFIYLNKILEASFDMLKFKIKLDAVKIKMLFGSKEIKIFGNFTQLQEVFFNIIDNAYDAILQRKSILGENDFAAKLEIEAVEKDGAVYIYFRDNGIGVRGEHLRQLFTPFFTTKFDGAKKGTGLGLFVIRQIVEKNHLGKVNFTSKYCVGSEIEIVLPVAALASSSQ
ncbi:MAG: GAF domain-containing protein [Candidatus Omnitrophica bacterium]|nr:GAF domain-containing protein [Candidatus Omnitrophota bacterium]